VTLAPWLAVALGTVCGAFLVGVIALATIRSRRRLARLVDAEPLLRYEFGPEEWRVFLRAERRKHLTGMALIAALTSAFLAVVWLASGGELAHPLTLAAGGALFTVALTAEQMWSRHYFLWARRRGTVSLFPSGVLIGGAFIDWLADDLRLQQARLSADGKAIELVLARGSSGGAAESWFHDDLTLPLPPGVRAEGALRHLVLRPGSPGP